MVNQDKTIHILRREKQYEEELVKNIGVFLVQSLNEVSDFKGDEAKIIREKMDIILLDSDRHERTFGELIDFVLNNGETNY